MSISLPLFPIIPSVFPNIDSFAKDVLQNDAFVIFYTTHVESVVSRDLLNIPESTFNANTPNNPVYNAQANKTCYWPTTGCINRNDNDQLQADFYTCPFNVHGLSYDDGPSEYTPKLLGSLAEQDLKATFFLVGMNIVKYPEIVSEINNRGHSIGIHTWTHTPLTTLSTSQIVAELMYTQSLVYAITGKVVNTFRPPYGDIDNRVRAIANALGLKTVLWNRDSFDTSATNQDFEKTVHGWVNKPQQGFISLQHDTDLITSERAIMALQTRKLASGSKMEIMPVSECNGHRFYTNVNFNPMGFDKKQYDNYHWAANIGLGDGNIFRDRKGQISESGSSTLKGLLVSLIVSVILV